MRIRSILLVAALSALPACAPGGDDARESMVKSASLDPIAESYAKLVLAVGQHDDDYVDAYYGPPEWREAAGAAERSTADIGEDAQRLIARLAEAPAGGDGIERLRHRYLTTQLSSLAARVDALGGTRLSFDEESRALYDAVAPTNSDDHFRKLLDELEPLLPGEGPLVERYERFRSAFVISRDRLDTVFRAAIDACRERTERYLELPEDESFTLEYVTDKPWSGYNWYQGGFRSLIQVNTDLPIYIDRAVDLACHEGYPGHHVYNTLLEKNLVRDRGWVEYSVYALFSPQSLIAEGTANYGIEMAFPGDERIAFERETLFPLAGLDPGEADRYYRVQEKVEKLNYAGNEAARLYLDGKIDSEQAALRLMRYALMPRARAEQRVKFIERYRSYVINYNLGQDLVRAYVEKRSGGDRDAAWDAFGELLASPRLPSGLR